MTFLRTQPLFDALAGLRLMLWDVGRSGTITLDCDDRQAQRLRERLLDIAPDPVSAVDAMAAYLGKLCGFEFRQRGHLTATIAA